MDHRYQHVKVMIEAGQIHLFRDIFKIIPKTVVAKDLRINLDRWNEIADDLAEFHLKQLDRLADNIGVDLEIILKFVWEEIKEQRKIRLNKEFDAC